MGAAILLGSAVATMAQAQTDVILRLGKAQFDQHCAVCHGLQGAGDGPLADLLTVPAENLATLAQRNGGRFPRLDVYQAIDGRRGIRAHGTDQMPIWGNRFNADALEAVLDKNIPHDVNVEEIVHGRIMSLVHYIETLQNP